MDYLERSNYLYKTSEKYRSLLDNICDNIEKENGYEEDNNYISASNVGLRVWEDLKEFIRILGATCLCEIEVRPESWTKVPVSCQLSEQVSL